MLLMFGLIFHKGVEAQDAAFSQFYANPLYLNPAYTGNTECGRLNLNYRNQWPSISKAFVTYSVSYDQSVSSIKSGFGLQFVSDRQADGVFTRNAINVFYSYKLQLGYYSDLSFGARVGYYRENLSWEDLVFADQFDASQGTISSTSAEIEPNNTSPSTVDFGVGLLWGYKGIVSVGFAADHLSQPALNYYEDANNKLNMKLTANAGLVVNVSKGKLGDYEMYDFMLQPNLLYQQQGEHKQINLGLYASLYPFIVGAWVRNNISNFDVAILLIGINYSNIRIGYSYDFTISKLGMKSGGAHEISFAWDLCIYKSSKRVIRTINSPGF